MRKEEVAYLPNNQLSGQPVGQHEFEQNDFATAGMETKKLEITKHFLFLELGRMILKILEG